MSNNSVKTFEDYISQKPGAVQKKLKELREIILASLIDVKEAIKWGEPAIVDQDGMILIIFAGYKQHMNLVVTPSTREALASKLAEYKTGKGSIQFPYDKPLPAQLIKELVVYRANEYRQHGVKWM